MPITRHTAKNDPNLKFWAEEVHAPGGKASSYHVVSQVDGFPGTEAYDDWLANLSDADAIAQKLAADAPAPDAELVAIRAAARAKN